MEKILEKFKSIDYTAIIVENGNLSLGRVSFWLCMGLASKAWWQLSEAPETLMAIIMTLAGYNLGKKARDVAHEYVKNKSQQGIEE